MSWDIKHKQTGEIHKDAIENYRDAMEQRGALEKSHEWEIVPNAEEELKWEDIRPVPGC